MSKFAIRLLTPATYAAALVIVPAVTPAKVTTNSSKPKKHWDPDFGDPGPSVGGGSVPGLRVRQRRPAQASTGASGVGTSPPAFDDDPDRKHSSSDGGWAMKVFEEYLENALAFEQLAAVEIDPTLKDDFEKQAVAFRKLAAERAKRLALGAPENSD